MSIDFKDALEGWVEREEPAKEAASSVETSVIEKFARQEIMIHKKQITQLVKILSMASNPDEASDIPDKLKWYAARSETYFLRSKKAVNIAKTNTNRPTASDKLETYGKWNDERYRIEKGENCYIIYLPPMISQKITERKLQEGRAIYQLVLYLIKEYMTAEQEQFEIFEDATIIFEHHIDEKEPEVSVPDPDNIDIKKVIDALHGLIIESDNLLHLSLYHTSYLASWPHTKLIIKKGKNAPQKN